MSFNFLSETIVIDDELTLGLPQSEEEEFTIYKLIHENRDHLLPWMDWIHMLTFPGQKRVYQMWREFPIEKGFERILYYNGTPIGSCGIRLQGNGYAEIGYWIAKDYTGRGIVTRAAAFLTETGFTSYELHRVEIHCAKENQKSANVAKRLGYTHEATLRERHKLMDGYHDLEVYGILETEWEASRERLSTGERMG